MGTGRMSQDDTTSNGEVEASLLGQQVESAAGEIAGAVAGVVSSPKQVVPEEGLQKEMRSLQVQYGKLPWGIWLMEKLGLCCFRRNTSYKILVLVLTFCCYTSYHLSRKPTSVVKVALCPSCANCNFSDSSSSSFYDSEDFSGSGSYHHHNSTHPPGWAPFNEANGSTLLGILDYSWLFAYAIAMYFSGALSDRLNLRYFLTIGMIGSGICTCLMGVSYFAGIHKLYYFIIVQVFGGALQSTGWPSVVAVMGHWFGKNNRGLIMGVWNSHTSVGNILGTIIPSFWADCDGDEDPWGWSFLVPGFIIIFFGIVTYLLLVSDPTHVGVPLPVHHLKEDLVQEKSTQYGTGSDSISVTISNGNSRSNHFLHTDTSSDKSPLITSHYQHEKPTKETNAKAVNFLRALTIPGVVEYALALFFNKLVSYTFLYWLPLYVKYTNPGLTGPQSDWLSTLFDVGGILGGILAGVISDRLHARAITCVTMLVLAVPFLFIFRAFGSEALWVYTVLLIVNGLLINGPYGIITTAVSSDLGTHPSLKANQNAKATVTAIIDGTGSLGAAVGPLLIGVITRNNQDWTPAFYLLMASCFTSALFLSRLVYTEVLQLYHRIKGTKRNYTLL